MKTINLSLISFNAMGLFSFDTLKSLFISRNILTRIKKLAELLEKEDTDIIMLQEIHTYSVLKLIRKKLHTHPYIAYKKFIYGPRGGLVIFSKHPLEKIVYTNFEKRGSLFNESIIGHIIRNGVLSCKIQDTSIRILNTHLTPNMDTDWIKGNKYCIYIESQLAQIAKIIKKLSEKNTVLIAGDFNSPKDSYLYKKFTTESGAIDVFGKETMPTQHPEFIPKNKKIRRIDHIFLLEKNAKTKITSVKHLFQKKVQLKNNKSHYLSDHIGLRAEFDLLLSL